MKFTLIFLCLFVLILSIQINNGVELSPTNDVFSSAILTENETISLEVSKEFVEEVLHKLNSTSSNELIANLNDYSDRIFVNLDSLFTKLGLDPLKLSDSHQSFNYLLVFGSLDLTEGYFEYLSSMHRDGDVQVSYDPVDTNTVSLVLPITFDDLLVHYHYKTKLYFLGPSGNINGTISNFKIEVKISFDLNNYQATLDYFYIRNSGHIGIKFSGNILTDWLVNLLTNLVTALLKRIILLIMEAIIRDPIQTAIASINAILNAILNPSTTVASLTL